MNTNGHSSNISADEMNRIMDEWGEITDDIKKGLHNSILKDSRSEEECEFDVFLTHLIPMRFPFEYGAEPSDLDDDSGGDAHYMWNCPKFSQKIHDRARRLKKTTREYMEYALSPVFRDSPRAETIESLKRLLLMRDGHRMLLKRILGEDDPEKLKSIPEFTVTRA